MKSFRWQTALNPQSKTSTRDRRRGPRAQQTRFRPWADMLEDRVVLTTYYPTNLTLLANDIHLANTNTNTVIDLTNPFVSPPATWTTQPFNPAGLYAGATLSIVNDTSGAVTISMAPSNDFLSIGAYAGAVAINGGTNGITLEDGNAANGGAINYGSTFPTSALNVTNLTFTGNSAVNGGAVYAAQGTGPVNVDNSVFGLETPNLIVTPGNTATAKGGAIDDEGSSRLTIDDSTFMGNTATGNGGAVYAGPNAGPLEVNSSTFGFSDFCWICFGGIQNSDGNDATAGGAIYDTGASPVAINSTTFVANAVTGGDGERDLLRRYRQPQHRKQFPVRL